MRKIFSLIFLILSIPFSDVFSQDDIEIFELVESVPAETNLEQSALPRTKEVWLNMINEAKESIDIETFYFATKEGEPLEEIIDALKKAAERGVVIRIIVDSSFYYRNNERSIDVLEGIENIFIGKIPMSRIAGGVMHAKYFIVDKENIFLGSQNMDWRALKHIHEIGVRISSKELANSFGDVFNNDWEYCGKKFPYEIFLDYNTYLNPDTISSDKYGKVIIYPAFSPPQVNKEVMNFEETELLKIIENTKDSLLIQIYSYSSKAKNYKNYYDIIDNALRSAASRGVRIKMILPDWAVNENSIQFIKHLSQVENISIKFITIPQYSEGYIPYARVDHSKYFISDNDNSWISTSNWEWGYFYSCRNATLVISNELVCKDLSKVFNDNWYGPYVEDVDLNKEYIYIKRD